jgi:hypothetical protein
MAIPPGSRAEEGEIDNRSMVNQRRMVEVLEIYGRQGNHRQ